MTLYLRLNKMKKLFIIGLLLLPPMLFSETEHDDHEHESKAHNEHNESGEETHEHGGSEDHDEGIQLSKAQLRLANIKIAPLNAKIRQYQVYAPGEIKTNGYTSYLVSPRADSVVLKRHVALGEKIKKGQKLVTLFSEAVAETQATFRVVRAEWLRVKKLGRKAVGDKRFIKAQTDYEAAYGHLQALGLSKTAIQYFIRNPQKFGEYQLRAAGAGIVLNDDFHQGQRVEAGQTLIELADESTLWVEARIKPDLPFEITKATQVRIKMGKASFNAQISQLTHTLDPITRTRIIRLTVQNKADQLHAGLFVDVFFLFDSEKPILAVPESALMRGGDGDWTVFMVEKGNQFKAQEVELGRSFGQWREIKGIHSGARIVMQGAFFVASQMAKGGFDPHNH